MGSIVLESAFDRLPHQTMFGGAAYAPDTQAAQSQQRQTPARTSQPDAASVAPRSQTQPSADTPMTDAAPRASSESGHSRDNRHSHPSVGSSASSATGVPASQTVQHIQGSSSRPPPSPRFRGQHGSQQHTPTSATNPTAPPYPASVVSSSSSAHPSPSQSVHSVVPPAPSSPNRIKVRSLSHIQSFANDDSSPLSRSGLRRARRDAGEVAPQYDICEMPVTDIIEMVAGLLTKITTTNDRQHEHIHRQIPPPEGTAGLSQQTNSVLAFHGKNVPQISILSYLSRIHKYCPTTYEVFLSLLVYFDRMTERVNAGPMQSMSRQPESDTRSTRAGSETTLVEHMETEGSQTQVPTPTPPDSGSLGRPPEPDQSSSSRGQPPSPPDVPMDGADSYNLSHFFVVDSYNIHRLVIAGVTCASKFFSDIFYTNSRYAKVGGLPLPELNHLELQFLLLNDFRLSIPLEEIQAYGTMLVEFYAREVVAQQDSLPH